MSVVEPKNAESRIQDLSFSYSAEAIVEPAIEPYKIERGPHADLYFSRFNVSEGPRRTIVRMFAKTREVIKEFVENVGSAFQPNRTERVSLRRVVDNVQSLLKKKHSLTDQELRIQMIDQFGNTHIVRIYGETRGRRG